MIQQRSSSCFFPVFCLFVCFFLLWEATVSTSGMDSDVHSLTLSIQLFFCQPRCHLLTRVPCRMVLERLYQFFIVSRKICINEKKWGVLHPNTHTVDNQNKKVSCNVTQYVYWCVENHCGLSLLSFPCQKVEVVSDIAVMSSLTFFSHCNSLL